MLDVAGPSLRDLQNLSPNNLLGVSVIQRATACILQTLDELHDLGLIHGGKKSQLFFLYDNNQKVVLAITPKNMVFQISPLKEALDGDLRKLPDSRIEQTITVDGVNYPVVRSHHLPPWVEWNSPRSHVNRQNILLINYGHGKRIVS